MIIQEIHDCDTSAISSLWLRDVWMTEFWNFFQIYVHSANLCMSIHEL